MSQTSQGADLDLADSFPSDPEALAHFFEGGPLDSVETEAHAHHGLFTFGEIGDGEPNGITQEFALDRIARIGFRLRHQVVRVGEIGIAPSRLIETGGVARDVQEFGDPIGVLAEP